MRHCKLVIAGTFACLHAADLGAAPAGAPRIDEIVVTAPVGDGIARDRVPARAQAAGAAEIEALQPLDLPDLLSRAFGSVNINSAQNNPLQPDVNFRGQTASPLLGLPQGLAVYANGVRVNETFGDTVNWDLLPLSAIDSVQLLAGSHPVFGLNSLGGALSLRMKNGFNYEGTGAEAWGGSFDRHGASLQTGGNDGTWGVYGNLDHFDEDGWRDHSHSRALRAFAAFGYRGEDARLDLSIAHADSRLRGNGASPKQLLDADREAVFTHPDITQNRLTQATLEGETALAEDWTLSGNVFVRSLRSRTFNGDGGIFDECDIGDGEFLVEEGACTGEGDVPLLDQDGLPIPAEMDGAELDAINNLGRRQQRSRGASVQLAHVQGLGGERRNDLAFGAAWMRGDSRFDSLLEVASLTEDRSTTRTGLFADEYRTAVTSEVATWSLYVADTYDIAEQLSLTASARYDHTRIELRDRSGQSPELNGRHGFGRVNPAIGITWRGQDDLVVYASLAQASRAPTAVELACADEEAPCNLPNAFLADPPLKEVVARSAEVGVRGRIADTLQWHLGAFHTVNRDDIQFQATGGAQANVGFFANVGDTRRQGVELEVSQSIGRLEWQLDYTLLDATYRDAFTVRSPNHPQASEDGTLQVRAGRRLPGLARHQANVRIDLAATQALRLGADVSWRSGVSLRGDEANALGRTHGYAVVNLHGDYRLGEAVTLFVRIENLFDAEYENFGLLGDPGEVLAGADDPRFYGAGPPRGVWGGVRARF